MTDTLHLFFFYIFNVLTFSYAEACVWKACVWKISAALTGVTRTSSPRQSLLFLKRERGNKIRDMKVYAYVAVSPEPRDSSSKI